MHPDKIGPYLIDRKIGSGGMGNVYHGKHEDTGHEVAVKVLPASMAREEGFVLRFSREIEALRKLNNAYIVSLYEDGQTEDGSYYYSMDFVDGETLTAAISRRKKIPWPEVIEISLQIATALKAAHDAGIIHRDLKPSNLMVAADGQIKLTDFGVARVFATTRLTRTGGVVGTAEYMSPEQAAGKRATKHSDLYSLGAVMYVMLTGRPPFTGKLANEILHKHQFAQFDTPGHYVVDLPRLLEEYVCTLLEKKPDNRFPDAFVAIKKLQNVRARIEYEGRVSAKTKVSPVESRSERTYAGVSDQTQGADEEQAEIAHGPGPATMVRDFLRADLESQMRKSPIQQFFDNTYVLIGLFALVIVAWYYLSRQNTPDPQAELAKATTLMEAEPGNQWLRARDILEELLVHNALPDERRQMELWVSQANQFEFCRRLNVATPSDASRESEVQRLIRRAFDTYSNGQISKACQQLQAIQNVLQHDPASHYMTQFLAKTLIEWTSDEQIQGRRRFLADAADQASELMQQESGRPSARTVLEAAILLYADDGAVMSEVETCKNLLNKLNEPKPD